MQGIDIISPLLEHLASTSATGLGFKYININALEIGVIHVRIRTAQISIKQESRLSFQCQCSAYLRHSVETCAAGALALSIAETGNVRGVSKTESLSDIGGNQLESSIDFTFYHEVGYDETIATLNKINWTEN